MNGRERVTYRGTEISMKLLEQFRSPISAINDVVEIGKQLTEMFSGALDALGVLGPLGPLDGLSLLGVLHMLNALDVLGAVDVLDALGAPDAVGTLDAVDAVDLLGSLEQLRLERRLERRRRLEPEPLGPLELGPPELWPPELGPLELERLELEDGFRTDPLNARVPALLLVIVEKDGRSDKHVVHNFSHLIRDLEYLAGVFRGIPRVTSFWPMMRYLTDEGRKIRSCVARLSIMMDQYAVDGRIRNAVGLAELGTGVRTVKELAIHGVQEHQLAPPFAQSTSDTALQIAWMASNPPWSCRGGFADLFIGWDTTVGKVALKRLRVDDNTADETIEKRFERERAMWQRLRHPHILPLLAAFTHDNYWYLVSPFMKYGSLADYIKQDSLVDRSRLLRETAEGLAYLHAEGVVHGDIKADNILLSDNLHAQICDFGLAKLSGQRTTRALQGVGSLRWQSPELLKGGSKTLESDIYAFGMTIAEVLAGDVPFPHFGNNVFAFVNAILSGERPPKEPGSSLDGTTYARVWNVAEKCWSADPKERISMSDAFTGLGPYTEKDDDSPGHLSSASEPSHPADPKEHIPMPNERKAPSLDTEQENDTQNNPSSASRHGTRLGKPHDSRPTSDSAGPDLTKEAASLDWTADENHSLRSAAVLPADTPARQGPSISTSSTLEKRARSVGPPSETVSGVDEDEELSNTKDLRRDATSLPQESGTPAQIGSASGDICAAPAIPDGRSSSALHVPASDTSPPALSESNPAHNPNPNPRIPGSPFPAIPGIDMLDGVEDGGATSLEQPRFHPTPSDRAAPTELVTQESVSHVISHSAKLNLGSGSSTTLRGLEEPGHRLEPEGLGATTTRTVLKEASPTSPLPMRRAVQETPDGHPEMLESNAPSRSNERSASDLGQIAGSAPSGHTRWQRLKAIL